jgi:Sec-independent protein translocase protein TatA
MAHAKRVAVPLHASPQRCIREDQEKVPWATIVILILVLVVVLALWGKLPSRLNQVIASPARQNKSVRRRSRKFDENQEASALTYKIETEDMGQPYK